MFFRFSAILLLSLLLTLQVDAAPKVEPQTEVIRQEGVSIQMKVHPGFGGYYRSSIPFPVTVDIFNGSERAFDGFLRIDTTMWVPRTRYYTKVHVERNEEKQFHLYVFENTVSDLNVVLENNSGQVVLNKNATIKDVSLINGVLLLSLSENPEDFDFLHAVTIPGFQKFLFAPDQYNPLLATEYNLSSVFVCREIPSSMSDSQLGWMNFSAIYCDLASYANMNDNLKSYLKTWVRLGGELMLYPSGRDLNESEISKINGDLFLPFTVKGKLTTRKISGSGDALVNSVSNPGIDFKMDTATILYSINEHPDPIVASVVSGTGGITVFRFMPSELNQNRLREWVDILFQLDLLTPYPYYSTFHREFMNAVSRRTSVGDHIPQSGNEISRGISSVVLRYIISMLLSIVLVAGVGAWMISAGKRSLYFKLVMPILIVLILFGPLIVSKKAHLVLPRHFEGFHLLNFNGDETHPTLFCSYVVKKVYSQEGTLKLQTEKGNSFYDEMVSGYGAQAPNLVVNSDSPGSIKSLELTGEPFRYFISMCDDDSSGSIDGRFWPGDDGKLHYEINNRTSMNLTNCEIEKYGPGGMSDEIPRMLPDMAPNQTLTGILTDERDDQTLDNNKLLNFSESLIDGIFSANSRLELFYTLEGKLSGMAFKPGKQIEAYSGELQFFAWTQDFKRNPSINGSALTGPETTLVVAKLKNELPAESRRFDVDLNTLIPQEPNVTTSVTDSTNDPSSNAPAESNSN